jgi:hypothetical protein
MALKNGQPEILVDGDSQSQAGGRNSLANSATYTKYMDLVKGGSGSHRPVTSVHWHGTFGSLTFRLFKDKLALSIQLPCG